MAEHGLRFRQVALGVAPAAAGIVLTAGMLTAPWEGGGGDQLTRYYSQLAAHPLKAQASTLLIGFGWLLFIPTFLAMWQLTRRRATRLGNAGWLLGTLGFGLMAGITVTIDVYDLVLAQQLGVEQAVALSEHTQGPWALAVAGITAGFAAILGALLMAAALWRSREVPARGPAAFAVGAITLALSPPALLPMTFARQRHAGRRTTRDTAATQGVRLGARRAFRNSRTTGVVQDRSATTQ